MPDMKLLQTLAHLQRDCPECGGSGEVPCRCVFDSTPHNMDKCPNCTDGKVFVLDGVVRMKCKDGAWITNSYGAVVGMSWRNHEGCHTCGGLGTVASQDMGDWVKALMEQGWVVQFEEQRCVIINENEDGVALEYEAYNPDPKEALIIAIQKAVGEETDDAEIQ